MKRTASLLIACCLALPAAAWAQGAAVSVAAGQAPGVRGEAGQLTLRARVLEIDPVGRRATLRGPRGDIVTVDVPAEVGSLDRVRAGDTVVLRYAMAVAAALEPAGRSGIRERVESSAATPTGATRTVETVATIQSIDRKNRTVTLRGVHRTVKLSVPDGIDMKAVKTGDEVRAVFTEAAVLSLEPAAR
jgi:hypothetical protein